MSVSSQAPAMFEQLFRGITEPYAALAADSPMFTVVAVNDAFVDLVGVSRDQLEGREFLEVFSSLVDEQQVGHLTQLRETLERVAEVGGTDSVGAVRLRDGRWLGARQTAVADDSGQVAYVLHRIEQIADDDLPQQLDAADVRASLEKRAREQFYELFMNAPVFVAILDGPDHVYTLNNPVHDEMLGHRQLLGRPVREALPESFTEEVVDLLDRVYETGEIVSAVERRIALPDIHTGEIDERYINSAYLPRRNLDGDIDGVVVIGWDVTELVNARKIVEKQAARLRQESDLKDEFLAMLGHELRNPLAPLATVAQVLELQKDNLDPSRVNWAAQIISRQVTQLSGLVDDLLDVARISEGRIELEPGCYGLHEIIDAAVDTIVPLVERSEQTFEISLPDDEVVLEVDKTRLTQVLSNLLHNATKYTPDAGRLRLEVEIDGDEVLFVVEDTGQGIDEEILPHIFDLFRQSDKSLARTRGGLGLGLTLVRRLVEMHGGDVCALSDGPGQGSRFEVRLPVVCTAQAEEPSPHAEAVEEIEVVEK